MAPDSFNGRGEKPRVPGPPTTGMTAGREGKREGLCSPVSRDSDCLNQKSTEALSGGGSQVETDLTLVLENMARAMALLCSLVMAGTVL